VPSNRVLVVDDDASILRLVATILRRERYDVDTASGGREAISKIALTLYDVIVLDLMMPGVTGLEVLRSFDVRIPHVRRVVVISAGSALEIARSIDPNVFASLRKPFDYFALVNAVRGCIDAARDPAPSGVPIPPVAAAA